jgi:GYF domain 2
MEKFYYLKDEKRLGPFTIEELLNENISPDTLIWSKNMEDWKNIKDVPAVFDLMDIPPPPPPPIPKKQVDTTESSYAPPIGSQPLGNTPPYPQKSNEQLQNTYIPVGGGLLFVIIILGLGQIISVFQIFSDGSAKSILKELFMTGSLGYAIYLAYINSPERKNAPTAFLTYLVLSLLLGLKDVFNSPEAEANPGLALAVILGVIIFSVAICAYLFLSGRCKRTFNSFDQKQPNG